MHSANGYHYRNALHCEFHALLCTEAEKRLEREGTSWIEHERRAMCDAVNSHRMRLGKTPITMADVERVETMASGHVDYGTKFARYCTELTEDRP